MAISALAGIADNVLSAFVSDTTIAGTTRKAFGALFLPDALRNATTDLSPRELVSLLLDSRSALLGLSNSAARLDPGSPLALFHGATVTSSNPDAVTAQVRSGISSASRPESATHTLTVAQVAVAQVNVGTALSSSAANAFATGTNTLRVVQNGRTTDVGFSVGAADSNLTVLNALAAAVNGASGLGVSATVSSDTVAGTSRLVLTSRATGTTNAFTIGDQTGTPASNAGVGSATTVAQNASYTLDGAALTSNGNDLFLGPTANLHLTLLTATGSPVVVSVKPDVSGLANAIGTLADAYNAARALFATHQDVNPAVADHLSGVTSRLQSDLSRIGITVGGDGSLTVDASALTTALTQHYATVVDAIGGARGLAPELRAIADTNLARPSASIAPLPPFQTGYAPQLLTGTYAARLGGLRFTGLLIDALS